MTDPTGPKRGPDTPFDTAADRLRPGLDLDDLAVTPDVPADPEARAFAGGAPKARPVADAPLKEAARDLKADGEALFAAGVEDARRWAEQKRAETAERVRDEPMKAVGLAFGIGLVAGLILRRR